MWDYATEGMYFVTICTAARECFFGNLVETQCIASLPVRYSTISPVNKIQLNDLGETVEAEWLKTPQLRPDMNLEVAEYVVMPNHFHGIINIGYNKFNTAIYENSTRRDAMLCVSELDHNSNHDFNGNHKNKFGPQYKNLASIIRGFKAAVTTYARKNNIRFDWQPRFHDHIITTDKEYRRIADYIIRNPENWHEDQFYLK